MRYCTTSGGRPSRVGNTACNTVTSSSSTDCCVACATRCTGCKTLSGKVSVIVCGIFLASYSLFSPRQPQRVMNYFFRNLHLHECQLDALWTFIPKKAT